MGGEYMLGILDLVILAFIGFGMYRGARKGIIKRATTVFSILAGVIFGWQLRPLMEILYLDYLRLPLAPEIVFMLSFATAFIVIFIISSSILSQIGGLFRSEKFQLDNALGSVFGGVIATAVLSVVFMILSFFSLPSGTTQKDSFFYQPVKGFVLYTLGAGVGALGEGYNLARKLGFDKPGTQDTPAASEPAEKPSPIR